MVVFNNARPSYSFLLKKLFLLNKIGFLKIIEIFCTLYMESLLFPISLIALFPRKSQGDFPGSRVISGKDLKQITVKPDLCIFLSCFQVIVMHITLCSPYSSEISRGRSVIFVSQIELRIFFAALCFILYLLLK